MSAEKWKLIKRRKNFYVGSYRRLQSVLVLMVVLNVVLGLSVAKVYLSRPDNKFYATNGIKAPEELTFMDQPNTTSVPMLPDDPLNDDAEKIIPQ